MYKDYFEELKLTFEKISGISCEMNYLPAPHTPNKLEKGKQGVYIFMVPNRYDCLKVGKAGPKSKARFNSHHYCVNKTKSCLANSIMANKSRLKNLYPIKSNEINKLGKNNITRWLKTNTTRVEFLIPDTESFHVLNLLEAFMQFKLIPVFEGKLKNKEFK